MKRRLISFISFPRRTSCILLTFSSLTKKKASFPITIVNFGTTLLLTAFTILAPSLIMPPCSLLVPTIKPVFSRPFLPAAKEAESRPTIVESHGSLFSIFSSFLILRLPSPFATSTLY